MIVHFFTGERYHLIPSISKGYITTYRDVAEHRYIILGDDHIDRNLYDTLYGNYGFTDYSFCLTKWQFVKSLWQNRNNSILFHEGPLWQHVVALIIVRKKVNWICWGSGTSIHSNWKSLLSVPVKRWAYNRFNTIVTLIKEDRETIIRDFHVLPNNIFTIPYASAGKDSEFNRLALRIFEKKTPKNEKPIVLLGNNPGNMVYYLQIMEQLKGFRGKIRVHCMMNYALDKNDQYYEFIRQGNRLFGDDFQSNEEFYKGNEAFLNYINGCDIYMCANPEQSGLGAMNVSLLLGKKVYVTGKNYDWAKKGLGTIVFNLNELTDYDSFVKPLTEEEKKHNFEKETNHFDNNVSLNTEYLKRIDN